MTTPNPSNKVFATGSIRDGQGGKPRPDLISPIFLMELGQHCADGAMKYSPRNWEKGQPLHQLYASMMRHIVKWSLGETDEPHARAAAWNWMAIIHTEKKCLAGELPDILLTTGPHARYTEEEYIQWEKEQTHEFKLEFPDDTDDIITCEAELYIFDATIFGDLFTRPTGFGE